MRYINSRKHGTQHEEPNDNKRLYLLLGVGLILWVAVYYWLETGSQFPDL